MGEVRNDHGALNPTPEEKADVAVMQVQVPFKRAKQSLLKIREISLSPRRS